jgi:hypothetical protein
LSSAAIQRSPRCASVRYMRLFPPDV